ncbi:hypothetical protein Aperf_G00000107596 [Anoplocephala perfoliata]
MTYNNRDLPRLANLFDLQVPPPRVYIPSSLSNTRLTPINTFDYQGPERQAHHSFGRFYYQCPSANPVPRTYSNHPGLSKSSHHDSDSAVHYCDLCKVNCTLEEASNPKEVMCVVCNVKCSSAETYNSHLKGKQHAKTVKLQKSRGCEVPDIRPQSFIKPARPSSPVIPEDCIKIFNSGKDTHYSCRLCNCVCNSVQLKETHVKGKKHQQALRKLKALSASDTTPGTFASPPPSSTPTTLSASAKCKPEPPSPGPEVSAEKTPTSCAASSPCQVPSIASTSSATSVSSSSSRTSRPHLPPTGFARPPAPCVSPSVSMPPLISLPPHLLADERYMQTKLRHIAPSKEENALLTLAVDSVSSALRQIYIARGDSDETPTSSGDTGQPTGVFVVGPAALGLLLGGQQSADMVMVLREPPSSDCIAEVREELEELLKKISSPHTRLGTVVLDVSDRTYKDHRFTVKTEEGALLIVKMSPLISVSPQSISSTAPGPSQKDISTSENLVATVRIRLVTPSALNSEARAGGSDQKVQVTKTVQSDPLIEVRRISWLQETLSLHPDKTSLLNVARLIRCLVRDSLPISWGDFPDYVLLILLDRLSFVDLPPPRAYRIPQMRPGLLFRRFLECLAAGVLIGRDGELTTLPDPLDSNILLLDQIKQADRVAITSAAQETLRLVAFRQIHKLLNLPKFVPSKNGVKSSAPPTTGKRAINNALNGSSYGENGGFGGEVSLPTFENSDENHFPSRKVPKLEQGKFQGGIKIEEELAVRNPLATN